MNFYMIVEGARTEMDVYPVWLSYLAPNYKRVDNAWEITDNNYYLFSGGGIPSIFDHITHAIEDVNNINKKGQGHYDYILVCIDTEEESREYILNRINDSLIQNGASLDAPTSLEIFDQKICMETWFLGNRKYFKKNPQSQEYLKYIQFYNVGENNPEEMGNIDQSRFSTTAKFHHKYLKRMIEERNEFYSKSDTHAVQDAAYLHQLIDRYNSTHHINTFGRWYNFIINHCK